MVLNETIRRILAHPGDGALTFVTSGESGPHLAATWNSYVTLRGEEMFIPAGGMKKTQTNLEKDDRISLILAGRHVMGLNGEGAGFYIEGRACFIESGEELEKLKKRFPWARALLCITPVTVRQIN